MDEPTKQSIETEFPGWEVWSDIKSQWHARIKGAVPPVMVHADNRGGLRDAMRDAAGSRREVG
jgi:hypothetical protein